MPKTKFSIGYEYFDQSAEYTLNSFKASIGYVWKESVTKEHTLEIFRVNLENPTRISPAYQLQLDTNVVLARSIEKTFIIGPTYNFNLNTQLRQNHNKNNFYFNGNIDLSSNILGILSGADVSREKQKTILNVPYSQYIRGEIDFRHYLSFSQYTVLVSRITGGAGYAYGNSYTMPFVKEFFAGGANDIRAFRSRSLGPGSFYAGNRDTAFIPDQPGDIKMEMNAEFRFKLFSIFRWAFFVDAGNTWTFKYDSSRVGSQFTGNWLNQVAVGVGTGLRLDISILLLRLDLGIPVREPYLAAQNKWVFDTKNTVLNFAIGYPF
jgi:outer membrane protein assembly factor BamA